MAQAYRDDSAGFEVRFDLLVIDEAQDSSAEWVASLRGQLREGGLLIALLQECFDQPADLAERRVVIGLQDRTALQADAGKLKRLTAREGRPYRQLHRRDRG